MMEKTTNNNNNNNKSSKNSETLRVDQDLQKNDWRRGNWKKEDNRGEKTLS